MKNLYIISGCNGAGKTTSSYTILPEILECREFVNADEIAKGLSPFQPETVSFQAGRLMLEKIHFLLEQGRDFAFETTLATKSYKIFVEKAQAKGYRVILLYFWLNSPELAILRVKTRVAEGGHNIPKDVIRRRYENGLKNFFTIFQPIVNEWFFINNSENPFKFIAEGTKFNQEIYQNEIWNALKNDYYGK